MKPAQLLVATLLTASRASAWPIAVWTRPAGSERPQQDYVDVTTWALETKALADPHYGGAKRWYRGVELKTLFEKSPPGPGVDLALLHFQNGMVIPVHFNLADEVKKLGVFIATETSDQALDQGGAWAASFPDAAKPGAEKVDRRPLHFDGNKLVVASGWHPMVSTKATAVFSPWRFADTLIAVEYVNEAAWYGQFDFGAATRAGLAVFRGRCQFCHGVEKVGASYGWDVVRPYPLYKHRDPKSLKLHTRHRELDAAERGLMMPAFPEITPAEIDSIWKWFEAAGTLAMPAYAPK